MLLQKGFVRQVDHVVAGADLTIRARRLRCAVDQRISFSLQFRSMSLLNAFPEVVEDVRGRSPSVGSYFGTKVLSCMIGIRMEKTMKATPPPMATIITGSSSEVSAETRISTCAS